MQKIELNAYAKINLALKIMGRREDGFHLLDMAMAEIGLFDTVEVTIKKSGITLEVPAGMPGGMKNTAYKAAALYFARAGIRSGANIRIVKHIPERAGLGGGSSNAGAVLKALDKLYRAISPQALHDVARQVGADVPFFLTGGTARCRGVGDIVEPLHVKEPLHIVVLCPKTGLGTPLVYQAYDKQSVHSSGNIEIVCGALEKGDTLLLCRSIFNDLEEAASCLCPEVPAAKEALLEEGALAAMMSGSGTSVFGIYASGEEARGATEKIRERNRDKYRLIFWQ
ncbi:MAG: 4-(cytidine 5'-diphospho)-2-C-methyl-D-erythritol kinase [Bacillota bacterium]|nr:4-(cytidine 5'-diphospho)-2-C-methyl-D-erythritol kinase [Bacillota bacterium]